MHTIVDNLGWFLLHYAVAWIGGTFIVSLLIKIVCKSRVGTRIFGKNISKLKLYAYSFVLTVAILGHPWVYFLGGFKGLIIDEKGYPIRSAQVSVEWPLQYRFSKLGIHGFYGFKGGMLASAEIRTDENGVYHVTSSIKFRPLLKRLSGTFVYVGKSGYAQDSSLSHFAIEKGYIESDEYRTVHVMTEAKYRYDSGRELSDYYHFRGKNMRAKIADKNSDGNAPTSYLLFGESLRYEMRVHYTSAIASGVKSSRTYGNNARVRAHGGLLIAMNCARRIAETKNEIGLIQNLYCRYLFDLEEQMIRDDIPIDEATNVMCPGGSLAYKAFRLYLPKTTPLSTKVFCDQEPSLSLADHSWREEAKDTIATRRYKLSSKTSPTTIHLSEVATFMASGETKACLKNREKWTNKGSKEYSKCQLLGVYK